MMQAFKDQDPADAKVTTISEERQINTFFRLDSPSVVQKLVQESPEMGDRPDARAVFLKLRELRNRW